MNLVRKISFILCAAIIVQLPTKAMSTEPLASQIDKTARTAVSEGLTPGLAIAVVRDGVPVIMRGYGLADLELSVPVTEDSVFRIGSLTKQFTAAAIMKLAEEGRLSLDDRLSKYFPQFPRSNDISLRQLLNHTSGIHNYTEQPGFFASTDAMKLRSSDEMIAYIAALPITQDFEPGSAYHYSNSNYFILGAIVEKVEKAPLSQVLRDRFFVPLGMLHTAIDDEREVVAQRVAGYASEARGRFANAGFISMSVAGGAGAMRSTVGDLVRWNTALFDGKVLKPTSLQEMTEPGKLANGSPSGFRISLRPDYPMGFYGFGFMTTNVGGHKKIFHSGGINGFNAQLIEFPQDKTVIVVLSNTIGPNVGADIIVDKFEILVLESMSK